MVVIAIALVTETGSVAETDVGCEDVTDAVNLITENLAVGDEEAVELGGERDTHIPIVHIVESRKSIDALNLFFFVPRTLVFLRQHLVVEIERGVDVQVLEEIEAGVGADVMVHTVAPVLRQTRLHELLLFRMNGVLKITRILQGDFLIPALLAYPIFTLEGVEARYADVQLRQCQVNSGVAHVLIGADGEVHRHAETRESRTESHVRSSCRLCQSLRIVQRIEVVGLVTL